MEKKIWTKPEISVVEFEANEYVATCASQTKYTHATTEQNTYWLYLEATGDNDFDYNGEDYGSYHSSYTASEDMGGSGKPKVLESNGNFFNHMVSKPFETTSDQVFMFGLPGSASPAFQACNDDVSVPDKPGTFYYGWWAEANSSEASAKAKIWWDTTTARIHAAWGVNTHSA